MWFFISKKKEVHKKNGLGIILSIVALKVMRQREEKVKMNDWRNQVEMLKTRGKKRKMFVEGNKI